MIDNCVTTCIIKALSKIIVDGGLAEEEDTNDMDNTDTNTNTLNWANKALQQHK